MPIEIKRFLDDFSWLSHEQQKIIANAVNELASAKKKMVIDDDCFFDDSWQQTLPLLE